MTWPKSWTDMELYHWLALAGCALALLALVLALLMRNRAAVRVPASLAAALAAFAAGLGVGVILLTGFGYHWEKKDNAPSDPSAMGDGGGGGGGGGGPMMMRMGMPDGGGQPGRGGRGGRGGGGPSPKVQLANLVDKLDVLTRKPLAVDLEGDKKKKVLEQLRGLGEKDELTDEEAGAKLEALLKVLEGDRATLEAVGYNWPGAPPAGRGGGRGRGGPPPVPPNPFKQENNREHLEALQKRLEKGTAG
jgi:hypothetical protein